MKTILNSIFLLLLSLGSFAQSNEIVYNTPTDSLINYYIAFKPARKAKGLLILLTSFGETPQIACKETDIQTAAAREGLVTVFASLQYGTQTFFIDSLSQANIDLLIASLQKKYDVKDKPLYLGGFSLGGSGAVKYAERAYSQSKMVKPNAVFAIDPPLDFERMYYSLEYAIRHNKVEVSKQEANYFIQRLQYEFQSIPQYNVTPYQTLSPYSFSDTNQTNISCLRNCPLLLISEPDIIWQMEERNRSLYDLNTLDCSLAINSLRLLGNTKAKLILTTNKGYRKLTGKRNPHSWSIMDAEETLKWLLMQ